jgi:hypothetical protein
MCKNGAGSNTVGKHRKRQTSKDPHDFHIPIEHFATVINEHENPCQKVQNAVAPIGTDRFRKKKRMAE